MKTGVFSKLEGDTVTIMSKGIFRQADVYEKDGYLFAKFSNGFIRLIDGGRTSIPSVGWEDLITNCVTKIGAFSRIMI